MMRDVSAFPDQGRTAEASRRIYGPMPDQNRLTNIYRQWRKELLDRNLRIDPATYSPPLLIKLPSTYQAAQRRILFCGQETYTWKWPALTKLDEQTGATSTTRPAIDTFADFLKHESSIETLVNGYGEFAFAESYPGRGSPFWVAFREVQDWRFGELLWMNLSRFDYDGGSILRSPHLEEVLDLQGQIFASELNETQPDVIIFATGSSYDHLIERYFPGVKKEPLVNTPSVSRLFHPSLPAHTYRTYHPRGLRMQKRWEDLSAIRDAISAAFG